MTKSPPPGSMVNGLGLATTLGPARVELPLQPEDAEPQPVEQAVGQYFGEDEEHSRVSSHRVASLRRRLGWGAEYRVGDKLGRASRPCARDSVSNGGSVGAGVACAASGGEPLYGGFRSRLELVDGAGGDRTALDQGDVYAPGVELHPQRVVHGDKRAPGGAEGAAEGHSDPPPDRADIHYPARRGAYQWQEGLRYRQVPEHVDLELASEFLERYVLERPGFADAGVVHKPCDPLTAHRFFDCGRGRCDEVCVDDVDEQRFQAARRGSLFERFRILFLPDPGEDAESRAGQLHRGSASDTARCAGHDDRSRTPEGRLRRPRLAPDHAVLLSESRVRRGVATCLRRKYRAKALALRLPEAGVRWPRESCRARAVPQPLLLCRTLRGTSRRRGSPPG